jgi:hypothetical protein
MQDLIPQKQLQPDNAKLTTRQREADNKKRHKIQDLIPLKQLHPDNAKLTTRQREADNKKRHKIQDTRSKT